MKQLIRTFLPTLILLLSAQSVAFAQGATSPTFEIITPTEGQKLYGNKIPILFKVTGITLSDSQDPKAKDQGHVLLWLDQALPTNDNATRATEDTFTFSDVPYGNHKLTGELVTTDNKSLNPPQKLTINFASAQLATSQEPQTTATSFDKNTAFVILVVVALVILAAWWYTKDDEETPQSTVKPKKQQTKVVKKTKKKTGKK